MLREDVIVTENLPTEKIEVPEIGQIDSPGDPGHLLTLEQPLEGEHESTFNIMIHVHTANMRVVFTLPHYRCGIYPCSFVCI